MIDRILKQFTKAVTKLEKHEEKCKERSRILQAAEMKIAEERTLAIAEGRRAKAVAAKLRTLVSE